MNQVFLILAHINPEQLHLLIKQLQSKESWFFIHIDKKSPLHVFQDQTCNMSNITYISERYSIKWGGFNIVKATLALMKELVHSDIDYSHAHLISGQDIGLQPIDELNKYFSANADKSFLEYFQLPNKRWFSEGMNRVERYYLGHQSRGIGKMKRKCLSLTESMVNDVIVKIAPCLKKKIPSSITLYGGSAWWSLNRACIEWILDYVNENKKIIRFFRSSLLPDEMIFQTILLNGESLHLIENDNKRYINWEKAVGGGPNWLGKSDFLTLKQSSCFFARKVDFETGEELYNRLT